MLNILAYESVGTPVSKNYVPLSHGCNRELGNADPHLLKALLLELILFDHIIYNPVSYVSQ
jgi:hypothetical protein